jgi:hypothetical protein
LKLKWEGLEMGCRCKERGAVLANAARAAASGDAAKAARSVALAARSTVSDAAKLAQLAKAKVLNRRKG